MIRQHYNKILQWIEWKRFSLLLLSTILVLILPAFSGKGLPSEIFFTITMSFLFIQSMIVANISRLRKTLIKYIVLTLIVITWLKPIGVDSPYIELIKVFLFVAFFVFVMIYLIRFIVRSTKVDRNVLITAINIYLLAGIIGAFLAFSLYRIYPDAYCFPVYMKEPVFVNFLYYGFITLTTVGYGDITPRIPETQTLAYFISITGQLYVAIIIAFLVGKLLVHSNQE